MSERQMKDTMLLMTSGASNLTGASENVSFSLTFLKVLQIHYVTRRREENR